MRAEVLKAFELVNFTDDIPLVDTDNYLRAESRWEFHNQAEGSGGNTMARNVKYTLILMAVVGMIALAGMLTSGTAVAQDDATKKQAVGPGHEAEDPGARSETAQAFDNQLRKNPQVRKEIMDNPSLLNDPKYMAKHPGLQNWMKAHPDFQRAVKKNPDRMMHKAQEQRDRDVQHHQQGKEKPKPATGEAKPH